MLLEFAISFWGAERKIWFGECKNLEMYHIASAMKNGQ